jgi:hypothetical protein
MDFDTPNVLKRSWTDFGQALSFKYKKPPGDHLVVGWDDVLAFYIASILLKKHLQEHSYKFVY